MKVHYRRVPGGSAVVVRTHGELAGLLDEVSAASAGQRVPSMVEMSLVEDPWGSQIATAGVGAEHGFVQLSGDPAYRTTVGDPDAPGEVVYDYMGNATDVPAREEVPLSTVREVLAAFLETGGRIPAGHQGLHPAD